MPVCAKRSRCWICRSGNKGKTKAARPTWAAPLFGEFVLQAIWNKHWAFAFRSGNRWLRCAQTAAAADEIENLRCCGDRPGENVEQVQRRNGMEVRKDRINPDHAEHARAHDHDDSWHKAAANAAAGGDGTVHEGADAVGKAHDPHPLHACGDDVRIIREDIQKRLAAFNIHGYIAASAHAQNIIVAGNHFAAVNFHLNIRGAVINIYGFLGGLDCAAVKNKCRAAEKPNAVTIGGMPGNNLAFSHRIVDGQGAALFNGYNKIIHFAVGFIYRKAL